MEVGKGEGRAGEAVITSLGTPQQEAGLPA